VTRLTFSGALTVGCSLLLVGCAAWWLLVTVLVACEAIAMQPAARRLPCGPIPYGPGRVCPRPVRRFLLAGCGVAVATGVAGPALAAGGHAADAGAADAPRITRPLAGGGLRGLTLPDRLTAGGRNPQPSTLVVRPGDSLWSLARRQLPEDATDRAVAVHCRALYRANADRLGPDPDLIFPGTRLVLPELDPPSRKESR
jgi:hypothetical protein